MKKPHSSIWSPALITIFVIIVIVVTFNVAVPSVHAELKQDDQVALDEVQEKLKATFSNIENVLDFKESPIPGLYELNLGGKIIYYYPEKEYLLFGEIFTASGDSLTQVSKQQTATRLLDRSDMQVGINIGADTGKKIIEIIDPDCPYCRRYHNYITKKEQNTDIQRTIVFEPRIHASALPKIKHIICSSDQRAAYESVMNDEIDQYQDCPESDQILETHVRYIDSLGLSGTPSFVLGDQMIVGFKSNAIEAYLDQ